MYKHLITVLLLIAAVVMYISGFARGTYILIILGLILETFFWLRFVLKPKVD
jgi:hypothetical protein